MVATGLLPGVDTVGARLQIARILRRLAIDEAGVSRGDDVRIVRSQEVQEEPLHRLGVAIELGGVIYDRASLFAGEGLEVREEIPGGREVEFGLLVGASDDGIVGALE